jgi:hypothetical protein
MLEKIDILEIIKKNWSNMTSRNDKWNTAFCQKCGTDLTGFYNYCDPCKRDEKIKEILK